MSVDGPSGVGKSTVVHALVQLLRADGADVHTTAEPSTGRIGALCRELTETTTGHALACLYAADRYEHLRTEIRPRLARGQHVVCDRYVASGLVMQRFDQVDPSFLWSVNAEVDRPDLAVILTAEPSVIAARLVARGLKNRFQATPGSSRAELYYFAAATERLALAGFDLLRVDCTGSTAQDVAATVHSRLSATFAAIVPSQRQVVVA